MQPEQLSRRTLSELTKSGGSPLQTKNMRAIPAATLPTNTPTPIPAFVTAEPLSPPAPEVVPFPLGAGVGSGGEELPPDPPPWTKNGFTDSWRDVVIVTPPCSTSPMQFAIPELSAHERLISNWGREANTTASEGPWTIVAAQKEKEKSVEMSHRFFGILWVRTTPHRSG